MMMHVGDNFIKRNMANFKDERKKAVPCFETAFYLLLF